MTPVGLGLGMFVTIDAFETRVRGLTLVTVGAGIPHTRVMRCPVADREEVVMGEECCRAPGQGAMTCCALGREPRVAMAWVRCCQVLRTMAGYAFDRRSPKAVVGMARCARQGFMSTAGREIGLVVVEGDKPRRLVRCMTERAVRGETGEHMVNGQRSPEVGSMAPDALRGGSLKAQRRVTRNAGCSSVCAAQRERRCVVVECQWDRDLFPRIRGVAVGADHRERSVRRHLGKQWERQEHRDDQGSCRVCALPIDDRTFRDSKALLCLRHSIRDNLHT